MYFLPYVRIINHPVSLSIMLKSAYVEETWYVHIDHSLHRCGYVDGNAAPLPLGGLLLRTIMTDDNDNTTMTTHGTATPTSVASTNTRTESKTLH